MREVPRFLSIAIAVSSLSACSAAPLAEFGALSQAGISFADQAPHLLNQALTDQINRDSAQLVVERDGPAGKAAVVDQLETRNTLFEQRAATYETIAGHARTLSAYFVEIGRLADGNDDPPIGQAIDGLATQLSSTSAALTGVSIGGTALGSVAADVAPVLVGFARRGALQRVLRAHSQTVLEAIELQRKTYERLNQIEVSAMREISQNRMTAEVLAPFAGDGPLPQDWSSIRVQLLTAEPPPTAYDEAMMTADTLATTYRALAAGQATAASIAGLVSDVQALIAAVEQQPVQRSSEQ